MAEKTQFGDDAEDQKLSGVTAFGDSVEGTAKSVSAEKPGIGRRFLSAVTTDSPFNPMNWPSMISGAFESPFSDRNMAEANHSANVFSGEEKPEPFERGDIGEALGQAANAGIGYGLTRLPYGRMAASVPKIAGAVGSAVDPNLAGIVSPRLAHVLRTAQRIGKLAPSAEESAAFEPFRPNPAIANRLRFGGPAPMEYGQRSYPGVGMSGAPVAPAPAPIAEPVAPTPFAPNPRVAARLRFGGPATVEAGSASSPIPTRIAGTPASELPPIKTPSNTVPPSSGLPKYTGPNKVNPNISRNLRFTPGDNPNAGSASASATLGTRAEMMRQTRLRQQTAPMVNFPNDDLSPILEQSINQVRQSKGLPSIRENIRRR